MGETVIYECPDYYSDVLNDISIATDETMTATLAIKDEIIITNSYLDKLQHTSNMILILLLFICLINFIKFLFDR